MLKEIDYWVRLSTNQNKEQAKISPFLGQSSVGVRKLNGSGSGAGLFDFKECGSDP